MSAESIINKSVKIETVIAEWKAEYTRTTGRSVTVTRAKGNWWEVTGPGLCFYHRWQKQKFIDATACLRKRPDRF